LQLLRAESWVFETSTIFAPEQARKFRSYPLAEAMSDG
jgi:hypothetical protein